MFLKKTVPPYQLLLILIFCGCAHLYAQPGEWTWMHGDNTVAAPGVFGTQGVSSPANKPPNAYEPCEWKDNQGNFWLLGGANVNGTNTNSALWKFDPSINQWAWIKGPATVNAPAVYGVQGFPAAANHPGSRGLGAATWTDASGNLWLFGGESTPGGRRNDLWKYTIGTNEWTWMKGPSTPNDPGSYGVQTVANPANLPPSRLETSCSWTDLSGNLWLYGGESNAAGFLSDLWKYDIGTNNWTWMHGASAGFQAAVYGVQGVAAPANTPGGRWVYSSWTDLAGKLWLFGGTCYNNGGRYNDLWRYDPDPTSATYNQWTWVKGPNTFNHAGSYGTKCVPAASNVPPSKYENRARVRDVCGNFWMIGGAGGASGYGSFNDLWHYNVSTNEWTWVSGDNLTDQAPVYGAQTVSAPTNKPGGRNGNVAWISNIGDIWVFGGNESGGIHNDLFKYVPDPACTPMSASVTAAANTTICSGQSATLTASGGTSYSWSPGTQTTSSIVVNPTASTTYTVTGTGVCGSGTATVAVTVSSVPPPVTASTSNATICSGQNVTLTASGGTNYSWSHGGQTTSSIVVNPTASTTYTVTGSDICGSNTATVTVTVASTINATAGPSTTICSGQNVTLAATGGGNYSWNTSTTTSSIIVTPTATANYSVIVSNGNCSDTAYATVTVNSTLTVNAGTDVTVCTGTNVTLSASGGTNYNWSNGETTSSFTITPTGTTSYTVNVSDASGCTGVDSVTVTISPPPIATATGNTTICSGQTATLTASGGGNYFWNTSETNASITVSPTANATYSVIVSIGSCTDTTTASVSVAPGVTANISGNTVLCIGDATTLTATGGTNYSWSNSSTTNAITVNPSSTISYTVTTSNSSGCTAIDTITVTVSPPPIASASSTTICSGQTATLTATGGGNYSWSNGQSTNSILVTPAGTTNYSVIVSIGSCTATASASVVVNPNPTASSSSNVTITQGQSTTLSASGGNNYVWSSGDNGSPITVTPNSTTIYCVTVSDANNCADTACVTVTVEPIDCSAEIYIPNAFSPNNDGENDMLQLYYGNIMCVKTLELIIYDRWGEKVFETNDPLFTWNGTYKNRPLNTAVFVFSLNTILTTGEEINKKGNVSLIK